MSLFSAWSREKILSMSEHMSKSSCNSYRWKQFWIAHNNTKQGSTVILKRLPFLQVVLVLAFKLTSIVFETNQSNQNCLFMSINTIQQVLLKPGEKQKMSHDLNAKTADYMLLRKDERYFKASICEVVCCLEINNLQC